MLTQDMSIKADEIGKWSTALEAMRQEQRALIADGRWLSGPADLLSVIGWPRSELAHSAAIGWLLDPQMRHGLGSRFLKKVLKRCFEGEFTDESLPDLGTAWCEREVPCGERRIDVLVHADGLTLVIENKIDAFENPDQCETYFQCFREDPGARFVFLTPTGYPPATAHSVEAKAAWRPLSYRDHVLLDLRAVLAATAGDPPAAGRAAAEQYCLTLERLFT
jgi:hypothetical protein